jgi:3-hydroxyisobutyrate dehydrogenase
MMTKVAVLGTGLMGSGMARSMARAGLHVVAWNRTPDKALPLEEAGVVVEREPEAAVRDADVVVTMLFDGDNVEQLMRRLLEAGAVPERAVWAQCTTVGLESVERLSELAQNHRIAFVDAPVLGTRQPAENGALTVLVGGPEALRDQVGPVFDAIGSRTVWVGEQPGAGHRLKLAANAWVLTITAATAQSIGLAERLGVDPRLFLEAIGGGALDSRYAQMKGSGMLEGDFTPAFTLAGAIKDATLIEQATRSAGGNADLMHVLRDAYQAAGSGVDADAQDMSAVYRSFS